jgi:hypothetical protein
MDGHHPYNRSGGYSGGPRKAPRSSITQTTASQALPSTFTSNSSQRHNGVDSYRPRYNNTQPPNDAQPSRHPQSSLGGIATRINHFELNQNSQQASNIRSSVSRGYSGSGRPKSHNPLPMFQFNENEVSGARNTTYKIGDLVAHEYIRQARLNPRWDWTDELVGKWMYTEKDVHFVSTRFATNPAVQFAMRNGIITEIYDGDISFGPIAKVIPEFSYSGTGMENKNREFCAEHLAIMHHNKIAQAETFVSSRNKTYPDNKVDIEEQNPHPHAPWSAVLSLTHDSKHQPKHNSFLRITAPTLVYLRDPRLQKRGELDERSMAFLRGVILKTRELGSYNHRDRGVVDISKYPWLSHMDRFAPYRQQRNGQAVGLPRAPTARELMPPPTLQLATSKKRKASEYDTEDPEPTTPVSRCKYSHTNEATSDATTLDYGTPNIAAPIATTSIARAPTSEPTTGSSMPKPNLDKMTFNMFKSTVKKMSDEERRNALAYLQSTLPADN